MPQPRSVPQPRRRADVGDDGLEVRRGERLTGRVLLDGRRFEGCRFEDAVLVYSGIAGVGLSGCSFARVRFEFAGPAAQTLSFLQAMARPGSGLKDIVRASFPQVFGH